MHAYGHPKSNERMANKAFGVASDAFWEMQIDQACES